MRIAFFSDIHANQQAFAACLEQARARGADAIVLLGDYVGYGADPEWCVTTVMELVTQGAFAVRGNHDNAVSDFREQLNVEAQMAMEWTRGQLGAQERKFLEQLPLTQTDGNRLYVHSEASAPAAWKYVMTSADAARSISATSSHLTLCGHIHQPALYTMSAAGRMTSFKPITDAPIQILPGRRWLAVIGSVGQPRDGNPAASYAILDTERNELTYCRAAYDVELAAERIRNQALPTWLADRLLVGR